MLFGLLDRMVGGRGPSTLSPQGTLLVQASGNAER